MLDYVEHLRPRFFTCCLAGRYNRRARSMLCAMRMGQAAGATNDAPIQSLALTTNRTRLYRRGGNGSCAWLVTSRTEPDAAHAAACEDHYVELAGEDSVAAACSGGCVKCEYVRLPTSGIDSAWGCREADTLYTPCALPPFPPPPVPPSVVNVSSAPTSSLRTPPSTPGQPISPPSAIGSRSRLRPGQVGGITMALLLCLAGCVGCGIWYRIR